MGVKNTQFNTRDSWFSEYVSGKYVGYHSEQLGNATPTDVGMTASGGLINKIFSIFFSPNILFKAKSILFLKDLRFITFPIGKFKSSKLSLKLVLFIKFYLNLYFYLKI